MITDTTFFTNEPGYALLDRFKKTLKHVKYFDVLVGYFRSSGFHQLFESFETNDKIRIQVGLNVDQDVTPEPKPVAEYIVQDIFSKYADRRGS